MSPDERCWCKNTTEGGGNIHVNFHNEVQGLEMHVHIQWDSDTL